MYICMLKDIVPLIINNRHVNILQPTIIFLHTAGASVIYCMRLQCLITIGNFVLRVVTHVIGRRKYDDISFSHRECHF